MEGGREGGRDVTLHIEGLLDEELMVAGLVEEGGEPGLVPDAAVVLAILQGGCARHHHHPRQPPQLSHRVRLRRLHHMFMQYIIIMQYHGAYNVTAAAPSL